MRRRVASIALLLAAAACGDPAIIVPEVLHVLTILPPHGSVQVGTDVEPVVYFSHAVAATSEAASRISMGNLGAPPCTPGAASTPVTLSIAFEGSQVAHLIPSAALTANRCFSIEVGAGIAAEDSEVGPHALDVKSLFQTRP